MNFLKNSKYKLIIILSGVGLCFILIFVIVIALLSSSFKDTTELPKKEISFELKKAKEEVKTEPNNDDELLKQKVNTYKSAEAEKPVVNKNISFSSVFKDKQSVKGKGASAPRSEPKQSDELSQFLAQEIENTKNSASPAPISRPNPSPKPSKSNEVVEKEIRALYTQGNKQSPPKEKTEEELLLEKKQKMQSGFDIDKSSSSDNISSIPGGVAEIKGNIHGSQEIANGGLLAIRINEVISLPNGENIPRNTICFGRVSISKNRANITIQSIKVKNIIHEIALQVYSSDGLLGVPINVSAGQKIIGDKTTDVAGRVADQAIRSTGVGAIVSGVFSELTRSSKREKDVTVSFIDNQRIFLIASK